MPGRGFSPALEAEGDQQAYLTAPTHLPLYYILYYLDLSCSFPLPHCHFTFPHPYHHFTDSYLRERTQSVSYMPTPPRDTYSHDRYLKSLCL